MALRSRTIRVSDRAWQLIAHEAEREGVSINAWISEAAISRLVYARTRRNEQIAKDFDRIFDMLRELRNDP